MNNTVTRKDFLKKTALLGAATAGAAALLAACGRRPAEESAGGTTAAAACGDVSSLSAADQATRTQMAGTLKYVEKSDVANQFCNNCALYKAPAAGAACGGCQLFPGPVEALGHCASWAPKA